ncbi:MAG: hypothetical protein IIX93_04515 [Clostridia bacterium]|nr:hypothetical protein [Clostridia bacterium]
MAADVVIGIVIIALFAYAGRMTAIKNIRLADTVRRLEEDIKKLKNRTIEKRLPAYEALQSLGSDAFGKMRQSMKEDRNMTLKGAWEAAGGAGEEFGEENQLVSMLLDSLENLGRMEQEREYERALHELRQLEEKKRKEGKEKLKLYTSLGALTGLSAVIFLV